MPQDKPTFDPNKPYQPVDNKPAFDPNKPFKAEDGISSPLAGLQSSTAQVQVPQYNSPDDLKIESTLNFIQEQSLRNMRDDEKDILRNMMKNPNTSQEELSDAIVTLQGKKANQIDNSYLTPDYYLERNEKTGNYVPKALTQGEKNPRGTELANVWGTQQTSNDDTWYQDLGKTLFNIVPGAVGGVVDVLNLGTEFVTGTPSETLTATKQATEALKFKKDIDLEKPLFNAEGVQKFSDLVDPDRFNITDPMALWGTFNSALGSVGEFIATGGVGGAAIKGAKGLSMGLRGVDEAVELGKAAQKASTAFGAYAVNLKEALDAADEIGLTGRDRATFAGIATVPVAALDIITGLDSKIMNSLYKKSKTELLKEIGKGLEKDAAGNILPQEFKRLAKDISIGYADIAKQATKNVSKDILSEGGQEAAQAFALNASKQLWDKLSDEDKAKFGVNAFSAKSFGEYIQNGLAGLVGGVPMSFMASGAKDKHDSQSLSVYNTIKEGPKAVSALKTNLNNAFERGEISQQELDNANFKINAYELYEQETKDINLDDKNRRRAFEISFQIEGLKTEIPTNENEISALKPFPRAKVEEKQKQVKTLQKELNELVFEAKVKEEPVIAKEVEDKLKKEAEKEDEAEAQMGEAQTTEQEEMLKKYGIKLKASAQKKNPTPRSFSTEIIEEKVTTEPYKIPDVVLKETRSYKDISNEEYNKPTFNSRVKQYKLAEDLDSRENKSELATVQIDNPKFGTLNATMSDGKKIRFGSSVVRDANEQAAGGFRGNTYEENFNDRENPVGSKIGLTVKTLKDSGRRVIFIWNAEPGAKYGKHIGMAKESHKGVSNYSQADLDEMADLRMTNMGLEGGNVVKGKPTEPTAPEGGASVPLTITKQSRQQLYDLGYSKKDVDSMKPETANDVINKQETKQPTKEVEKAEVKETAEPEKETKKEKSISEEKRNSILNKIRAFNQLSFKEKKSEIGVNLRKSIQDEVNEIEGSLVPLKRSKIRAKGSDGKLISKTPVVRPKDVIEREKADKAFRKKVLAQVPQSFDEAVILNVANGIRYDLEELEGMSGFNTKDVPLAMIKKGGLRFEDAAQNYAEQISYQGDVDELINDLEARQKAIDIFLSYAYDGGRENAIKFLIERAERDMNNGYTNKELEDLIAYQKSLGLTDKEADEVKDTVDNLTNEEVKEVVKDEENGNKKTTEQIRDEFIGGETETDKAPDGEKGTGKEDEGLSGISKYEGDEDPFQKNKNIIKGKDVFKKAQEVGSENNDFGENMDEYRGQIENNDYVIEKVSISELRKNDMDLDAYLDDIDFNANKRKVTSPVIIGNPDRDAFNVIKDGVLDGFHRIEQALINGDEYVEAYVPIGSSLLKNKESFQKQSINKEKIDKIIDRLKKAIPNIKIVYDENLTDGKGNAVAGKWSAKDKTISINPFYAGADTPIHEYGHILIDAMGYDNKIIQAAIKQLESTDLWKETEGRYPELNKENLGKEVLAEAIGREGAGIFETEAQKSKFRTYLEYIFDWFKQKLGLDKNIAKSLAKQVIAGRGVVAVKEPSRKSKKVSLQMPSGERVNGVEVMPEVVDGFYSKLEKMLLQMKLEKAPAKQWKDKLTGEEAKWTGLTDWLTSKEEDAKLYSGKTEIKQLKNGKFAVKWKGEEGATISWFDTEKEAKDFASGSVTRQEIKNFLKNNRISLIEINKGRKGKASERDLRDNIEAEGYKLEFDMGGEGYMILDQEGEIAEYDDLPDNVRNWYDELAEVTNPDETIGTKYSQYQLEGDKENYREILVTMPSRVAPVENKNVVITKVKTAPNGTVVFKVVDKSTGKEYQHIGREGSTPESVRQDVLVKFDLQAQQRIGQDYRSSHWEEPNILVHLRMNERTDSEGNKVLFLEEVQSDWGQQGKREGFVKDFDKLTKEYQDWVKKNNLPNVSASEQKNLNKEQSDWIENFINRWEQESDGSTQKAPFVTDTNAWVKLGLKYALKQAVESGATKIAWTTGEQQNERYDLSKQVDSINYLETKEKGIYDVAATKENKKVFSDAKMDLSKIEATFGKDIAEKISNGVGENKRGITYISGQDLKVGGKGMKGFYDKILPDVFKSLVKELSGKSGELSSVDFGEGNQMSIDITPELAQSVTTGMPMFQRPKNNNPIMSKNMFRANIKLRNLEQEDRDLAKAEDIIKNPNTPDNIKEAFKKVKDKIERLQAEDSKEYRWYKASMFEITKLKNANDLEDYTVEQLQDIYSRAVQYDKTAAQSLMREVMLRIAYSLHKRRTDEIKDTLGVDVTSEAKKKDITPLMVKMKVLSHFTQAHPELQEVSKIFDTAVLNKTKESNDKKIENEELAKEVIKEKNKTLGVAERFLGLFSSDSAKYFEYMENPTAIEKYNEKGDFIGYEAGFYTEEQAKAKGFSKAQINYLNFVREVVAERKKAELERLGKNPSNADMEVLRVDKGFSEAFKTEGLVQAFSYYLGGGATNLGAVRILYNGRPMRFSEVEADIVAKANKGIMSKVKAIGELLYYNYIAKKQLKTGRNVDEETNPLEIKSDSEYSLNYEGKLTSKFDRPRNKERGYSKDYYKAVIQFIDDTTHVKYMNPIMPIIDSIEYLNKHGWEEKDFQKKDNTAEWISEWKKMQIFREPKTNDPAIDTALKFLRKLTSATTMLFNLPAQGMNAFTGIYNNFRAENAKTLGLGYKRLFFDRAKTKGKFGIVSPYAADIIRKYSIVSLDLDSNPRPNVNNIFETLGSLGTRWGEYQTQASLALGLMGDVYDAFEYQTDSKGVERLVVKDKSKEKEIDEMMTSVKNRVSDIQGKYAEKDRRNIMRGELGKAAFQFKVWIPDWWKERFGDEYIDRNNVVRSGTYRKVVGKGFTELKRQLREDGFKELLKGKTPESKAFMSNLKGLMVITTLLALKYGGDDDEKRRKKASTAEGMLADLLFIFDPDKLTYTIKNPVAAVGTTTKFIQAAKELFNLELDEYDDMKAAKTLGKLLPGKKIIEIPEIVSGATDKIKRIAK
jgi:hypothetical protein